MARHLFLRHFFLLRPVPMHGPRRRKRPRAAMCPLLSTSVVRNKQSALLILLSSRAGQYLLMYLLLAQCPARYPVAASVLGVHVSLVGGRRRAALTISHLPHQERQHGENRPAQRPRRRHLFNAGVRVAAAHPLQVATLAVEVADIIIVGYERPY